VLCMLRAVRCGAGWDAEVEVRGRLWGVRGDQPGDRRRPEMYSPTIGPDGTLYIGCQDDKLYAFQDEQSAEDPGA